MGSLRLIDRPCDFPADSVAHGDSDDDDLIRRAVRRLIENNQELSYETILKALAQEKAGA